jgi:prophage antirepressor-like protein
MSNAVQIFNSEQFGTIRTAGTAENPLFCLVDLCKALSLTPSKVAQRLDSSVLSKYPAQTGFGTKELNFVNEDGLYDVILDSRKPEARAFRKWVTSEVLPAIRRQGGYIAAKADESPELIMARALKVADDTIRRQKALIEQKDSLIGEQQARIRRLVPMADYAREVLDDTTATYTMTQVAQFLGFSNVAAFMDWTVRSGILYRQRDRWMPTPKYLGEGYFTTRVFRRMVSPDYMDECFYTVVTERGRKMLYDSFASMATPQCLIAEAETVEGGAL